MLISAVFSYFYIRKIKIITNIQLQQHQNLSTTGMNMFGTPEGTIKKIAKNNNNKKDFTTFL